MRTFDDDVLFPGLWPIFVLSLLATPLVAQSRTDLRVDKNVVLVPVSVLDWKNRPIQGLNKSNFRVFDDKAERNIESLSCDDEPAAIGIIFDTSSSMDGKLHQSLAAVKKFMATANPRDEYFLVEFDSDVRLSVPLTADPQKIESALADRKPHGRTSVLDAIHLGLAEIRKSDKPRKALLVISDGGDNHSRLSRQDIQNDVRESDAMIFAIAIYAPFNAESLSPEEMAGPTLLKSLAEETGGREFPAGYVGDLDHAMLVIDKALRTIYVLSFSPAKDQTAARHNVEVRLVPKRGFSPIVSWRRSY